MVHTLGAVAHACDPSTLRWGKKISDSKCSRRSRILNSPLTSLSESMVAAAQEREGSLVPIVVFNVGSLASSKNAVNTRAGSQEKNREKKRKALLNVYVQTCPYKRGQAEEMPQVGCFRTF